MRSLTASEGQIHRSVAEHLQWRAAPNVFWFHVPGGGYRTKAEAGIFRVMGVVAGVPDVLLLHRARLRGLELKRKGGRLSPAQEQCHARMRAAGCEVATAYGVDEALDQLRAWGLLR